MLPNCPDFHVHAVTCACPPNTNKCSKILKQKEGKKRKTNEQSFFPFAITCTAPYV